MFKFDKKNKKNPKCLPMTGEMKSSCQIVVFPGSWSNLTKRD